MTTGVLRNISHGLDVGSDVHLQVLNFRAMTKSKKRLIVSDGMSKTEHVIMSNQLCALIDIYGVFKVSTYRTIPDRGKILIIITAIIIMIVPSRAPGARSPKLGTAAWGA